jgi:hypothetical protein
MKKTNYTVIDSVDPYGKDVLIYRSADAKISVTVHYSDRGVRYEDGYWWVKIKTHTGPGRDKALNLSSEHSLILAEILQSIDKDLRKRSSKDSAGR